MTTKKTSHKSQENANLPSPDYIASLAKVMNDQQLGEIEWENEQLSFRLTSGQVAGQAAPVPVMPATYPTPSTQATQAPSPIKPASDDADSAFTSPMVGTVYLSSRPGEAVFVDIGKPVKKGDTVLIIEAMKVMNQIAAPKDGILTAILVEDGEPVEYSQPLFIIN